MVRYITLLLFFVFTISIPIQLQSQHLDFTNNIWSINHLGCESQKEMTPYESYLNLIELKSEFGNQLHYRNDFTHKLDRILGWTQEGNFEVNTRKSEFLFEYEKNTDLLLAYRRDQNNENWEPRLSILTNYKNNLLVKHSYTNWNGSTSNFDHSRAYSIREYEYNANDNLILYEIKDQQDIVNNRVSVRYIYHYDSLGLAKGISHYFWYANDDTITHVKETIYSHNDQEQLESIVNLTFDLKRGWEYDDSTSLSYDSTGNLNLEEFYNWNWQEEYFKPYTETYYTDYTDGQLTSKSLYRLYDEVSGEFFIKNIYDYKYYDYGSLEREAFFITSYYDPKELTQTWDYLHNKSIYSDQTMIPRYMNYEESRKHNEVYVLDEYENYSGLGNYSYGLKLEARQQYFYSEIEGVSTNDPIKANPNNLKLSPNPVIDNLRFEVLDYSGNVDIVAYDVNGHMVVKKEMFNKGDVDVSFLSSGVYFYTVRAGGRLLSGRFVKN